MAHRNVHYEAAFEHCLRCRGWPYVAVDETKKALFANSSLKSFDFLVYSESGANLLADVKGRKFPNLDASPRRTASKAWENWITRDDVEGLRQWQDVFGEGFRAVLVFAYWLQGRPHRSPFDDVHLFRGRHYAFVGVDLADYVRAARPRSSRWGTLAVPSAHLAREARGLESFL